MNDALSKDQLIEISEACTKQGQIDFLRNNRVPFFTKKSGWPFTTWTAINAVLVGHNVKIEDSTDGFDLSSVRG